MVPVRACVCVCVCRCLYAGVCECMCACVHMQRCVLAAVRVCVCLHWCVCVGVYVHRFVCVCFFRCVFVCACVYVLSAWNYPVQLSLEITGQFCLIGFVIISDPLPLAAALKAVNPCHGNRATCG